MLSAEYEPLVLAVVSTAFAVVRAAWMVASLWLTSRERQRICADAVGAGQASVVIDYRGSDGVRLTVWSTARAERGGKRR